MKWIPLTLLVAGLIGLVSCSDSPTLGNLKRLVYETPGRDGWAQPDRVVDTLALAPGQRVADVGAGGGYFAFRLARTVGPTGRVFAVDVDPALLAYVEREAAERGLGWLETVEAPADGPGLAAASVDLIFLANVFHHLPDPPRYFTRAREALDAGGRVAIVEAQTGSSHFARPEEIDAAMTAAGFRLAEDHPFLEAQLFRVYTLPPPD